MQDKTKTLSDSDKKIRQAVAKALWAAQNEVPADAEARKEAWKLVKQDMMKTAMKAIQRMQKNGVSLHLNEEN